MLRYKPCREHLDIAAWSRTRRFVLEPACRLPWGLAYKMAGDGGLVESLEDHTETEMEDELPKRIRSEQRGPVMTHQ